MKLKVLMVPASEVSDAMMDQIIKARDEDPDNELNYGGQLLSIDYDYGYLVTLIDSDSNLLLASTMLYIDKRPEWLNADLPMIEPITIRKLDNLNTYTIDVIVKYVIDVLRNNGYKRLNVETDESQALYLVAKGFYIGNFGIVYIDI